MELRYLKSNKLKILFSTDQHLNHSRLNAERMGSRLLDVMLTCMGDYKPDVVLLGGDWFDRPTSFTSKSGVVILDVMATLVAICAVRGIALRVLKGTGSHDGTQNDNWAPLAKRHSNLDFRIYDEVDIIEDFGLNILTIPDSTIVNHHKCEKVVRTKMIEKGLTKVDLIFSHGMFTHHVANAGFKVEAHDSEFYNEITRIICLNGHVHTPSLYVRILTGGSTDRLRQGENHAKGIHLVEIDIPNGTFTATFIENIHAAIFNSYDVYEGDPNEAIARIGKLVRELDADDIYVRLLHEVDVPIRAVERALTEEFPKIVFESVPNQKALDAVKKARIVALTADRPVGITRHNITELFQDKLGRMNKEFTPIHKSILMEIANES